MTQRLNPEYTFEVVSYNPQDFIGQMLATTMENTISQLENRTVWIETIPRPLKHGDQFTVAGKQAVYLKELYVDVPNDSPRKLLKIV